MLTIFTKKVNIKQDKNIGKLFVDSWVI